MIHGQQESIDTLKQMLAQLLEDKKKLTNKASSKKSKGKRKKGESSSSVHIEEKGRSNSESSKSSSKEEGNPENGGTHSKRMSQLEQHLEALTNRKRPPRSRSGLAISSRVGPCSIPSYVQSSDPTGFRRQRITEPTHLLLQVSNRKCDK